MLWRTLQASKTMNRGRDVMMESLRCHFRVAISCPASTIGDVIEPARCGIAGRPSATRGCLQYIGANQHAATERLSTLTFPSISEPIFLSHIRHVAADGALCPASTIRFTRACYKMLWQLGRRFTQARDMHLCCSFAAGSTHGRDTGRPQTSTPEESAKHA
jgi:hypothetical protein